jgi:hypothetical protein
MNNQIACGAVLTGVLGLCMLAGTHREAPLVGHQKLDSVPAALEERVARHPDDAQALTQLCRAYMDRGAPGLALAAMQRAPEPVRQSPRVTHLWAVALLHEGRASDALDKERVAIATCNAESACAPWFLASAMRHELFLNELVRLGIEDYRRDPDGTVMAYSRLQHNTVAVLDPASFSLSALR